MQRKIFTLLFSLSFAFALFSQHKKNHINFDSLDLAMPLDIPLVLAGNFGELRKNHFHTGLDFKTQRVEGKKIFAIEKGYVSRIKVSHWGYGKVIYINHPNGLTSVYAHCSKFPEKIDSIIRREQTIQQNDQIEYFPKKNEIEVSRKELIAYSGNSGSSSAPHLHFEIRETKTEHALNPLLFKCFQKQITDHKKPNFMGFKVYSVSKEGYRIPNKSKYFTIKTSKGKPLINNGKPVVVPANFCSKSGGIGIAFHTDDLLDAAGNHCGIFHTSLFVNDTLRHTQEISHVDFSTNRYINTHMDYERYNAKRVSLHKQFCTNENALPIYPINNGIIHAKPGQTYQIKGNVKDVHGNWVQHEFPLIIGEGKISNDFYTTSFYFPGDVYYDNLGEVSVQLGKNTIYEPEKLKLSIIKDSLNTNSNEYYFGNAATPVHQYFDLKIQPKPTADTNHLVLLLKNEKNHWVNAGGNYKNGLYHARLRSFGGFKLATDSIPPYVQALNFKDKGIISDKTTSLKFKLGDNLSGLNRYLLYINGKWHLLTRYRKKGYYALDDISTLKIGKNKIELKVSDAVGNSKTYQFEITKSN